MREGDAGGLGRNRDFLRLWVAQAVSALGARISREGFPLTAVLVLGATPAQVGLLAAAVGAPAIVVGLAGGGLVDRTSRRRLMIITDLARAAILIATPAAALTHHLNLAWLLLAAAAVGALSDLFEIADNAFLPGLVGHDKLVRANARLAATEATGEIGGPALAGVLVSLLTAPVALAVNSAAYLFSAAALATIRHRETAPAASSAPWRPNLSAGLRVAWGNEALRAMLASTATTGLFGGFFAALYVIWALRGLGLSPALLGATIAMGGIGALIGSVLAVPLAARLGIGRTIIIAAAFFVGFTALIPLAHGPRLQATAMLMAAQLVGDAFAAIGLVLAASLRQSLAPADQLGRLAGAFVTTQGLAAMGGALGGGALGGAIGLRPTLALACVGLSIAPLCLVASPIRSIRKLPV